MNLPDLYNRVVAKRPDLAVPFLEHCPDDDPNDNHPWIGENNDLITETTAAALILARWVEALPESSMLYRDKDQWRVVQMCLPFSKNYSGPFAASPLEALAAFYLGGSQ